MQNSAEPAHATGEETTHPDTIRPIRYTGGDTPSATYPDAPFWHLSEAEQAEFENIREFIAERAGILEFDAGMTQEAAYREAERLAMQRFPPNPAARASILRRADEMADSFGLSHWRAATMLTESQVRRLHIDGLSWLALYDSLAKLRARRQPNRSAGHTP